MKIRISREIEQSTHKRFQQFVNGMLLLVSFLALADITFAQQGQRPDRGYQAGNAYSISDIESINNTNGNLIMNIPLAELPAGRSAGGGVSLHYNSKLWDAPNENREDGIPDENGNRYYSRDLLEPSGEGGWKIDSGLYSVEEVGRLDLYDECILGNRTLYNKNGYRYKLEVVFPNGSRSLFRPSAGGQQFEDYYKDGYFSINSNGHWEGWSMVEYFPGEPTCGTSYSQVSTSGMNYYSTDGSGIRLFIPYTSSTYVPPTAKNWKMYFPNGSVVENLPPDDTSSAQRTTSSNGNRTMIKPGATYNAMTGSKIEDSVGRFIFVTTDANRNTKIYQIGVGAEALETTIEWKDYWVRREYKTTDALNARSDKIMADGFGEFTFVDKITLPSEAGSLTYEFTYDAVGSYPTGQTDGWAEMKTVKLPTGADVEYAYREDTYNPFLDTDAVLHNAIVQKDLTHDGITETWTYSSMNGSGSITGPNGGATGQSSPFNSPSVKGGAYLGWDVGLVYAITNPDGSKVEKLWKQRENRTGVGQAVNAYVKTEFTTVPNNAGNPSLTAIKDYVYDQNYNILEVKEYEWVEHCAVRTGSNCTGKATIIPGNAVLRRKSLNTYYNSTPGIDSTSYNSNYYADPNSPGLLNLVKSTEIQDGNGNPVSRTEFIYDNSLTAPTKGNLTESRSWDSTKQSTLGSADGNGFKLNANNSLVSTVAYDNYGNPTLVTDASGVQTKITYGAVNGYSGLYPTMTETAYGTTVQRTSTAAYDFYTGLVTSTTDVDNNLTNAAEYDALGRWSKAITAVNSTLESWTRTEYDDTLRRVIVRSYLETKGDGKKIAIQHYDQLGRVRLSRTIENNATENPYNEYDGIKVQTRYQTGNPDSYQLTSNPYRAATAAAATNEESMGWTRSKSVNTSRHSEVETFTGASLPAPWGNNLNSTGKVQTDIDADRTLVTDQSGKQRISKTNALGQLINVWEVKEADADTEAITFGSLSVNALKTGYQYDALNNLTTVIQGVQTRSFTYSSLSRLKSAINPESGTNSYLYANNGNLTQKTDARGVRTDYVYDALNRVTNRNYSTPNGVPANYQATPNVVYTYDDVNIPNSKGKLTKVTNGFSTTDYQVFDGLGRVMQSQQTTDGAAYGVPMTYTYNLSGAMVEQKYPSGRVVKNVLDNDGDLAIVQSKKNANAGYWNYADSFTYTAAGAVSSMQLGNGKWESTQFNSRLQPTQIALGTIQSGADKLKLDYSYGTTANNGNVLSQTITVPTTGAAAGFTAVQTYTYDSLNRLKQADEKPQNYTQTDCNQNPTKCWKQTFTFDRYGNRNFDTTNNNTTTIESGCPTAVCNPTIDPATNKLIGYTFDNSGNTTVDASGRTFTYDAENKQIKVVSGGNTIGEYFYDGDGKRVKKYVPTTGETTIFIYDASGKMVAEYSTIVAPAQTAQVSYLTNDHLGSPRITTDKDGKVFSRRDFMPFGEEITSEHTSQRNVNLNYGEDGIRQKFTSYERDDETELDFAQARMHSFNLGRFTSPDPYKIVAEVQAGNDSSKAKSKLDQYLSMPQQWNPYTYAVNNPLKYTDPSGEVITIVAKTEEERKTLLKRIEKILGEERMRQVVTHYKTDEKLGDVIELSFLNGKDELQFANTGSGDEKKFSAIMSQIIGTNEIVEFRSGESYKTKSGKSISLKSEGGASTIGSADSTTGNVQVWVHPKSTNYYAYLNSHSALGGGKSNTDKDLDFTDDQVDAHEFGHAYVGLNGGDVNSDESITKHDNDG